AISSLHAKTAVGFRADASNWRVRFTPDSNEYSPGTINFLSIVILLALRAALKPSSRSPLDLCASSPPKNAMALWPRSIRYWVIVYAAVWSSIKIHGPFLSGGCAPERIRTKGLLRLLSATSTSGISDIGGVSTNPPTWLRSTMFNTSSIISADFESHG